MSTKTIVERTFWEAAPQLRAIFPKENDRVLYCFGAEVWKQQARAPSLAFLDSLEPGKPVNGHISIFTSYGHMPNSLLLKYVPDW